MGGSSSKNMSGQPFTIASQAKHTATLIFLHGLGDTGQGWADGFRQLKLKHIKCVCPNAPIQSVSLNAGMKMPSWFDIKGLSPDSPQDEAGIKSASEILNGLISTEEKAGISSENIIVGGFSQGGAVAMYNALSSSKKLGGIVALSTWLPLHKQFTQASSVNRDIPVFQGHGDMDPLVPFQWGQITSELLKRVSSKHTFKSYPNMGHMSCPEEMNDVSDFLNSIVKE